MFYLIKDKNAASMHGGRFAAFFLAQENAMGFFKTILVKLGFGSAAASPRERNWRPGIREKAWRTGNRLHA